VTATAPAEFRYPKLRPQIPVLQRSLDEVQIGVDSQTALVFAEPRLKPVLLALDGTHHLQAVRAAGAAHGLRADEVDEALRVLGDSRMLLDGGRGLRSPDALGKRTVRLIGAGPLGRNIATLLAGCGIGQLWVIDNERCEPGLYRGQSTFNTRAEALRAMVTKECGTVVHTASHWMQPSHLAPNLTIIACELAEPDRLMAAELLRADLPHLVVRQAGEAVIVGPLVVPGRTACLACTDLTRRDADPAWPSLLDQLTRLRLPTTDVLINWAACLAATQALAFLRGGSPEACGATIELGDNDLMTRWRGWPAHPRCGCHWFPATEWVP
jgi:hypothetical protein